MNFFRRLLGKTQEAQTKFFVKGLCHAMTIAALAAKEKYTGKKYYSEYAVLALSMRPGWKQLNDKVFKYKDNQEIIIENSDSLVNVIEKVCDVEMPNILEDLTPTE